MKRFSKLSLTGVFVASLVCALVSAQEPVAVEPTVADGMKWYDATQWPVENKPWTDVDRYFARFPARSKGVVTDAVWNLSQHSAGEVVRFRTNADKIKVRYNLYSGSVAMPHMPATGVSGFDLYAFDDATNRWLWVACTQATKKEDEKQWIAGMERKTRDFLVYLPLYNGVDALSIGVPEDCEFTALSPRSDKPIVYYGTSIAHGGCASRPGNCYTAMLSRRLDIPVVNLGFSGSARMEPAIAELMAEVDAEIYVIDALPNMGPELVAERAVPFVKKIRETRPDVPILLVEDRCMSNTWILPERQDFHKRNQAELKKAYEELKKDDPNLYYLGTENILGEDLDFDGTVDGSHPNDLGMWRQCNALEAVLRPVLEEIRAKK
ncbi:MAG: SGNH/GDSL hydrolase family protein [Thermoguttaceae bacterium]|nr:SGNH/GDSL hydrolase family protein [Thermoguttaceae bacterium]